MTIQEQVREHIVENFLLGADDGLGNSDSLLQSGVLDSTGVLELVMFLEKTFGLAVANEDLVPDNLDSIDRIAAFVQRKAAPQAPAKTTP